MKTSINKAFISGNLTRDPELRETPSGFQVLSFGVAVNDHRKNNQTGQWEDYTNYLDCVLFGARAASVSRYLAKGTRVNIEGKLRWLDWSRFLGRKNKLLQATSRSRSHGAL